MAAETEKSKKLRFNLIGAAWLITIVATLPGIISFPWFLPLGFFWFISRERAIDLMSGKIALCWIPYIGLTIAAAFARRKAAFIVIYSVLCLLLIVTAAGCREMFSAAK